MAEKLSKANKRQDLSIKAAVMEIAASENLRAFIRGLLVDTGFGSTPCADNALVTARLCGRHEIGMSLIATIQEHDPNLFAKLMYEENKNEQADDELPEDETYS